MQEHRTADRLAIHTSHTSRLSYMQTQQPLICGEGYHKPTPANQATATWDAFKEECYGFYPKSNETRRYTPAHLEEAARILRASPILTLDEFGRFDRYIQNIGIGCHSGNKSAHVKTRVHADVHIRYSPYATDDDRPTPSGFVPKPNPAEPFPVEEVRKAAKYALESYKSPYVNPAPAFLPYAGVEQQAPAPALQYAQPPAVAPLSTIRATADDDARRKHIGHDRPTIQGDCSGSASRVLQPLRVPLIFSSAASSGSASCSAADDHATSRNHRENGVFNGGTAPGCDSEAG